MPAKLIVFDWDGTLCDSTAKICLALQRGADEVGLSVLTGDQIQNIIGLGLPEAIRALYPSIEQPQLESLQLAYTEHYAADISPNQLFPDALETLDVLRDRGHLLAVATSKSRYGLSRVLTDLGMQEYFDASRCADETRSKPDPLMLNELLSEQGVHRQDAVMVGDTEYDMEMARRADVRCIAVDFGAHSIERLTPYKPIACLSELGELLHL
jgi:phosphoglycolate phosphatase